MECPHLSENVKLESTPVLEETDVRKEWLCTVCSSNQNSWVCVHCGYIGCGRYVNGHAKDHAELNDCHNVCMDCESLSVFCYSCDEFVINDTQSGHLEHLRKCFINNPTKTSTDGQSEDSETTTDTNEEVLVNGDRDAEGNHRGEPQSQGQGPVIRLRRKVEDGTEPSPTNKFRRKVEIQDTRKLRPRIKRSYSTDSSSVEDASLEKKERDGMTTRTLAKNQRDKKVVGLRNLGNTCFMNAVLQSLSNIGIFYRYFEHLPALELNGKSARGLEHNHLKEVSDALMAEELRKVLINLNQGGKSAISPESLFSVIWKIVPRFRGYQQQDAHEFLRYMLDRLHLELLYLLPDTSFRENSYLNIGPRRPRGRSSIVTSVFGGTLQSEVRCLNCSVESKKHDPFLDLSLDIPEKFQFLKKNKECGDEPTATCDISDCLTSFIEVEELAETELYHCNNCKSKQRSTKRFWIRRLPNVLCLHLKRFRWNNCFRQKIDTSIMFPVTALNMSQYVLTSPHETRRSGSGSTLYDLAAVIVHHGSGTGSGHYTAFAINDDGVWWHFNDSSVRQTEIETVAKCKPYIMFYIRREFQLPPLHA